MKPNSSFKVTGEVFLKPSELQSLTFLYQPIIGVDAFSLYHILLGFPNGTEKKHHILLQLTSRNMDKLIEARHRLEAAGLLDVYETEECVTYLLKQPLSINSFFAEVILQAFLYVKVGAQDFNALKNMLLPTATQNSELGTKVSKRFDEIFDIRTLTHAPNNLRTNSNMPQVEVGIDVATMFDLSNLQNVLVKKGITTEIITPVLVKMLNEIAFLYKFDVYELARLVFDAMVPDGTVDTIKMKKLARTQFQLMSKGSELAVVAQSKLVATETPPLGMEQEKIVSFLEQSPLLFLQFKAGGKTPIPADLRLIEWMHMDQGMPAGVVNVLVDYVLDYADGKLPRPLVESIVGQWQRLGINTTDKAMNQVATVLRKSNDYQKEKSKPQKTLVNVKRATRVEPIPEWITGTNANRSANVADDEAAKARIEEMKMAMYHVEKGNGDES